MGGSHLVSVYVFTHRTCNRDSSTIGDRADGDLGDSRTKHWMSGEEEGCLSTRARGGKKKQHHRLLVLANGHVWLTWVLLRNRSISKDKK